MFLGKALQQISARSNQLSRKALAPTFTIASSRLYYARFFSSNQRPGAAINSTPGAQSVSPLAPIGVEAAVKAKLDQKSSPHPKIFDEFRLTDRVGIVSGGARGLGLEMAMTLCEAGARVVYCLDILEEPMEEWKAVSEYVQRMEPSSRLEYIKVDVTDQRAVWNSVEEIGDKEGRMDVCIAAAGILRILRPEKHVLDYPADVFKEVSTM